MKREQLEKLLIVGAKIKFGKEYAKENGYNEGEIVMLIEGHFENDNGLYTYFETAPSIPCADSEGEFDSIYHLFGNNLESFMDCQVLNNI